MIATLIQLMMFITPAISALTLALKYDELRRSQKSVTWPTTQSKVADSQIVPTGKKYKGQNLYQTQLRLLYMVGQERMTTEIAAVDEKGLTDGPKQWARQLALQYKPESLITLYYNPQRPKQVTLTPGQTTVRSSRWLVIGALMLLFSFFLHYLSVVALSQRFMTLNSASQFVLAIITFVVMLIVGVLVYFLAQEVRETAPA